MVTFGIAGVSDAAHSLGGSLCLAGISAGLVCVGKFFGLRGMGTKKMVLNFDLFWYSRCVVVEYELVSGFI